MLANQCSEAVAICDTRQRILFANPAFERLTGVAMHELIGETAEHIYDLVDAGVAIMASAIPAGPSAIAHYVFVLAPVADANLAEERLRQFADLA